MSKENGGAAFPLKEALTSDNQGMMLRDYFAAHAMAAMLVNHKWNVDELAANAYRAADGMLVERAK